MFYCDWLQDVEILIPVLSFLPKDEVLLSPLCNPACGHITIVMI